MRSVSTRRVPSFWSASCPSSVLFVKSHKTSRFVYIPHLCLAAEKIDLICFSCSLCANCCSYMKFSLFSRRIWGSRAMLFSLFKRPRRLTLWVSSKIPTCALSMPRGSPLCLRTSSSQGGSVANVPKRFRLR